MQVIDKINDGLKREFSVVITASTIEDKISTRLNEVGQQVRLPGFRPGKVPMDLLRKRFGQSVRGEVLERTIDESTQAALTEKRREAGLAAEGRTGEVRRRPGPGVLHPVRSAARHHAGRFQRYRAEPSGGAGLREGDRGRHRRTSCARAGAPPRKSKKPARPKPATAWWWISSAASTPRNSKAAAPRTRWSKSARPVHSRASKIS